MFTLCCGFRKYSENKIEKIPTYPHQKKKKKPDRNKHTLGLLMQSLIRVFSGTNVRFYGITKRNFESKARNVLGGCILSRFKISTEYI